VECNAALLHLFYIQNHTGVEQPKVAQPALKLSAEPTVFSNLTRIRCQASGEGAAVLRIATAAGRTLRSIPLGRALGAFAVWDGTDASGVMLPAGNYFCILQSGDRRQTIRVTKMR
jgi:hypothetical protein